MKIGRTRLDVHCGDITKLAVDAVVNPANDMLWTGGGISAHIHHMGGVSIEAEALTKAPAVIGSAVVTAGGSLPAKRVIHAVISGQNLATDERTIRAAVAASLEKADTFGCLSLAIPLLDNVSYDVEIHTAAGCIVDETVKYLMAKKTTIERIVFVEQDESRKGVFEKALRDKFTHR